MTVVNFPTAHPYVRDAATVAAMERALFNWLITPNIQAMRFHIYKDIGISDEDAERLDQRALEGLRLRIRAMREDGQ